MSERTQTTSPEFTEWFDATYPEDSYNSMWRDCLREVSVRAWDAAWNAAPRKGQEERIKPRWEGLVPHCDPSCPSFDGVRCAVKGSRAGNGWICDPTIQLVAERNAQKPHHCDRYVDPSCQTCWPDGGMHEWPDDEGEGHGS